MARKTILVLFGGCSPEYQVSLQSAYGVLIHMDQKKYQPIPVGITKEGRWLYYPGLWNKISEDHWQTEEAVPCTLSLDKGKCQLLLLDGSEKRMDFDGAFPILHGRNGEDGTVQGLMELAGIPLIGCGTLASALCMDKDRAHKLAKLAGVEVPDSVLVEKGADLAGVLKQAAQIGYPLFVKPLRAGSSFGVSRVESATKLEAALKQAFGYDTLVLIEEAIPGFEVGCAVMGNQELVVGRVDEIELTGSVFDYEEKYTLKTSAIHCPARISSETAKEVQQVAQKVYRALGCRVFARVDLFLTPEGRIVFNEVNTIPGFTAHSRYPNMMREMGMDFTALISHLIELGVGK